MTVKQTVWFVDDYDKTDKGLWNLKWLEKWPRLRERLSRFEKVKLKKKKTCVNPFGLIWIRVID